jgi:hypothetical protein
VFQDKSAAAREVTLDCLSPQTAIATLSSGVVVSFSKINAYVVPAKIVAQLPAFYQKYFMKAATVWF